MAGRSWLTLVMMHARLPRGVAQQRLHGVQRQRRAKPLVGVKLLRRAVQVAHHHHVPQRLDNVAQVVELTHATTVMMLRFFEVGGVVRKSVAVIKTRTSDHERTVREFTINKNGVSIGDPIRSFSGILSGTPVLTSSNETLMPLGTGAGDS